MTRHEDTLKHQNIAWQCLPMAALLVVSFPGCGGGEPTPVGQQPATTAAATTGNAETPGGSSGESTNASTSKTHQRGEVWVDEKGQKWFGNVPYDAFFDQPYAVASDATPVGGNSAVTTNPASSVEPDGAESGDATTVAAKDSPKDVSGMSSSPPPEKPTETPATGTDEWSALMPIALLDEESKSIRGFLRENLQSVGNYNSSMLMIPPKAATLAVLAGIAMEHPEKVAWQDDAKYIRDLAKKMNSSALQRGAKDQKRLSELFEAVSDTMDRSKPSGLEEPPESDGYAETAEMRWLMNRMEECEKRLKTEAGTESAMASRKEMVLVEASILGSLAKVITKPGYGYEDD
ncbi:MAG: hypothetical protein ACK58L_09695, partial [Planctomycetota bacterium]